jgi:hypothetical protein
MESTLVTVVGFVATSAAFIKFALLECEGILQSWRRFNRSRKSCQQRNR